MTDRRLLDLLAHATLPCTLPAFGRVVTDEPTGRLGEDACGRCPNCRILAEVLSRERGAGLRRSQSSKVLKGVK